MSYWSRPDAQAALGARAMDRAALHAPVASDVAEATTPDCNRCGRSLATHVRNHCVPVEERLGHLQRYDGQLRLVRRDCHCGYVAAYHVNGRCPDENEARALAGDR